MAIYNYLIDKALQSVWCMPFQDRQTIIKPVRISQVGGDWNTLTVLNDTIKLPEKNKRFHAYMVGQLHPMIMGLFPAYQYWRTLAQNCTDQNMICDVYIESGIQLPRFRAWYYVTRNKNLIFVIQEPEYNTIEMDFLKPEIYLRVYSHAYWSSKESQPLSDDVTVKGKRLLGNADLSFMRSEFDTYKVKPGHTYAFVNGYKVKELSLVTMKVGDIVEFVYDSSIKAIYDFKVENLKTFVSELDQKRKYLLHYPGTTDLIDYQDDIDCFLMKERAGGQYDSIYMHKNSSDTLRMVTHKDYSIPVDTVNVFRLQQLNWANIKDLTIRLHIRKSGLDRPLIFESNRIHELYKLPDDKLVNAMLGADSTLYNFRAEVLENSAYTRIMRSRTACLDSVTVESALGYNSITTLLAATPKKTFNRSNQTVVDVPYGLTKNSTAFEYDSNGLLLGYYNHVNGTIYACYNSQADMVEQIAGRFSHSAEEYWGTNNVVLNPTVSYRFYRCPIENGQITHRWEDVTDSGAYGVVDGIARWTHPAGAWYTMIRGDSQNIVYSKMINYDQGLLEISLTSVINFNGVVGEQVMRIPMGELDVFLNNHRLIENLDYYVSFPRVVIINKEYLDDPLNKQQKITICMAGHSTDQMLPTTVKEVGFIDHALLSSNNRFDLRDDKVLSITVDGKIYDRSELIYAEDSSGVTVPDARNGAPYQIKEIWVPTQAYTEVPTYTLRQNAQLVDQAVSDYMTRFYPMPQTSGPNVTPSTYYVVSPFISRITFDLINNVIDYTPYKDKYSDQFLIESFEPYMYLLETDPTNINNNLDERYVTIVPHPIDQIIELNIYQYQILDRLVNALCKRRLELSHHYRIIDFGID